MIDKTKVIVGIVLFLNIVIIWLPTQFQTTAIQEEWRYRAVFDGGIITYNDIGSDSSEEQFYTRPLMGIMNAITYILTPDSFFSHHIVLMTMLFLKGLLLYKIILSLFPENHLLAYFCSLLLPFYPSDIAVVSLRVAPTYHPAIVMILATIYFFILYYKTSQKRYLISMWLSQFSTGLLLEIAYPIYFVIPITLFLLHRRITKRLIRLTIYFYIIPVITFIYSFVLIILVNTSWQRTALVFYTPHEYFKHIFNIYWHNFVEAWQVVILSGLGNTSKSVWIIFFTTATITLIGTLWFMRKYQAQLVKQLNLKILGSIFGAGFVLVFLGYAMYLVSRTHVLTNYRVYLLSSVGAAIVIGTVFYGLYIARLYLPRIKYFVAVAFSFMIGLSSVFAHKTHQEYLIISRQQESVARQISTSIPAFRDEAYIAIKMPSNGVYQRLPIGEIQKPVLFTPMLQYIYNDYENIQGGIICFTDYLSCNFESAGMTITASNFTNIPTPVSYAHLIIFDIDKAGNLTLIEQDDSLPGYNPLQLIDASAPPTRRIQTIFGES